MPPVLAHLGAWSVILAGLGGCALAIVKWTPSTLRRAVLASACWHAALLVAVTRLGYGFFHLHDPIQYHTVSSALARLWSHGVLTDLYRQFGISSFGYYYWVSSFYLAVGAHPVILQLANIVFALLAGIVTYYLAREFSGSERAAWWAAVGVFFYPTLAVWSVMLLKDIASVLLLLLALELILVESREPAWWRWVALVVAGFVASTMRFYFGILILGLGIVVPFLLRARPRSQAVLAAALAAAAMWATFNVGAGPWYLQAIREGEARTDMQEALAMGRSSLETSADSPRVMPARVSATPVGAAATTITPTPGAENAALAVWTGDTLAGWTWGKQAKVATIGRTLIVRSEGNDPFALSPNLALIPDLALPSEHARIVVLEMRVLESPCHEGQVLWRTTRGDFTSRFATAPSGAGEVRRYVIVAPLAVGVARVQALRIDPLLCPGQVVVNSLSIGGLIPETPLAAWTGDTLAGWTWGKQAKVATIGRTLIVRSEGNDPFALSPNLALIPDLALPSEHARIVVLEMRVLESPCHEGQVLWRTTRGDFTSRFATAPSGAGEVRRYVIVAPLAVGAARVQALRIDPLLCPGRVAINGLSMGGLPTAGWKGGWPPTPEERWPALQDNIWRIIRFFLVPLPSQSDSLLLRIGKLEWVFWWPLPLLALVGIVRITKTSWRRAIVVIVPIVTLLVFFSYFVANSGSIVRYRSMMFPLFACLGALGLDAIARILPARVRSWWERSA